MSFNTEAKLLPFESLLSIPLRNGIYKKKEFHGRGAKIVNMGELFAHPRIDSDVEMKRVELDQKETERALLESGDLIFARRSLTAEGAGKCALISGVDEPTTFESSIIRARIDTRLAKPEYFYYFFNSVYGKHLLGTILRQVAVSGITGSDLAKLEVPVPSLDQQEFVVSIVRPIDDKIEKNIKINQTLEQIAQAIFKSWFVDFEPTKAKIAALEAGGSEADALFSAMQAISGKTEPELTQLQTNHADQYAELRATAELFPSAMQESELGEIPEGWGIRKIEDLIERLKVGKKYSQKTVIDSGIVPVLDQGKSGIIGYHNDEPGVKASVDNPVVIFANHTCNMRLIMHDFSAIQNVLPFRGRAVDVYWIYYATLGKQEFIEYKGHWPDFAIKEIITAPISLTERFGMVVKSMAVAGYENEKQSNSLSSIRDALLPRLLSGEWEAISSGS